MTTYTVTNRAELEAARGQRVRFTGPILKHMRTTKRTNSDWRPAVLIELADGTPVELTGGNRGPLEWVNEGWTIEATATVHAGITQDWIFTDGAKHLNVPMVERGRVTQIVPAEDGHGGGRFVEFAARTQFDVAEGATSMSVITAAGEYVGIEGAVPEYTPAGTWIAVRAITVIGGHGDPQSLSFGTVAHAKRIPLADGFEAAGLTPEAALFAAELASDFAGTPAELLELAATVAAPVEVEEPAAAQPVSLVRTTPKATAPSRRRHAERCDRHRCTDVAVEVVEMADGRTDVLCHHHAEAHHSAIAATASDLVPAPMASEEPAEPETVTVRVASGRELLIELTAGTNVTIVKGKRVPHGATGTVREVLPPSEWGVRVTVELTDGRTVTTNAANLVTVAA